MRAMRAGGSRAHGTNLTKVGATLVRYGRYIGFQLAGIEIPRRLFANVLRLIDHPRPAPLPP